MLNLKKKNNNPWPSLLRDGESNPYNSQVWLEMQEQFDVKENKIKENKSEEEDEVDYDDLYNEKMKNKKKKRRPKYNFNVLGENTNVRSID